MSREAVEQFIERASTDPDFKSLVINSPETAFRDFDLTTPERTALFTGDPDRLQSLGIDSSLTEQFSGYH